MTASHAFLSQLQSYLSLAHTIITKLQVLVEWYGDEHGVGANGRTPLSQLSRDELITDAVYRTKNRQPIFEEVKRRLIGQHPTWENLTKIAAELQSIRNGLHGGKCSLLRFCSYLKEQAQAATGTNTP